MSGQSLWFTSVSLTGCSLVWSLWFTPVSLTGCSRLVSIPLSTRVGRNTTVFHPSTMHALFDPFSQKGSFVAGADRRTYRQRNEARSLSSTALSNCSLTTTLSLFCSDRRGSIAMSNFELHFVKIRTVSISPKKRDQSDL